MPKTRRDPGDASLPTSLFGLDERERGGKKKRQKKRTSKSDTSPQPTSVATEAVRESGALGREKVEGEEAVQTAILQTEKKASITKLSKAQWRQVTQVKIRIITRVMTPLQSSTRVPPL